MPSPITGPGPSSEPPRAGHAVHGLVGPDRVEVPDDAPGGRVVAANVAVERPREGHAGNGAHRARLRRTAARPAVARNRRRVPHARAVAQPQREHAATALPIGVGELRVGQHHAAEVRQRHVDVFAVGRRTPLHPAHRPALTDARSPTAARPRDRDRPHRRCRTCGRPRARGGRCRAGPGSARPRSRSPGRWLRDSWSCRSDGRR